MQTQLGPALTAFPFRTARSSRSAIDTKIADTPLIWTFILITSPILKFMANNFTTLCSLSLRLHSCEMDSCSTPWACKSFFSNKSKLNLQRSQDQMRILFQLAFKGRILLVNFQQFSMVPNSFQQMIVGNPVLPLHVVHVKYILIKFSPF